MTSFDICNFEAFVAEVTAQAGSLEEAASTQEILIQQIEGYLTRMRDAVCADVNRLRDEIQAGTFLGLTDTPASYSGDAAKVAAVNAGETALEFIVPTLGPPDIEFDLEVSSNRQVAPFGGLEDSFLKLIFTPLPNAMAALFPHGIARPFTLVDLYGTGNNPNTLTAIPLPSVNTVFLGAGVSVHIQGPDIVINTGVINLSGFTDSFIILEYVKS